MTPPTKLDLCVCACGMAAGLIVPLQPRPLIALVFAWLAGVLVEVAAGRSR